MPFTPTKSQRSSHKIQISPEKPDDLFHPARAHLFLLLRSLEFEHLTSVPETGGENGQSRL